MVQRSITRWIKSNVDAREVWFFSLAIVRYAAFVAWAEVIVRAVRGEDAEDNWKTLTSSAALITFSTLTSAAEGREFAAIRGSTVEMRQLVDDAGARAGVRDQLATERDRRAAEQQERMLRFTKWLVGFAVLTLAAAIATLVATFPQ
jgi:hypothetical protein